MRAMHHCASRPSASKTHHLIQRCSMAAIAIAAVTFIRPVGALQSSKDELGNRDVPGLAACENYRCTCVSGCGCGSTCGCGTGWDRALDASFQGFPTSNIVLKARLSLDDFGGFPSGNDSWGYVSPSGREYALVGLRAALGIVEITDPVNSTIVDVINHPSSLWGDVKVYNQHAYVVNESSGGVQILDLTDIDNGNITNIGTFTHSTAIANHNIAINEDSGYAYLCGSNDSNQGFIANGGLVALDLSNPAQPVFAGAYSGAYVHDAQIVTYTTGPNAGREIAFCYAGGTGIDIVDVTDKNNIFRISRTTYSGLEYCHQGWFDPTSNLIYVNDELDEDRNAVSVTTTRVFDVANLASPQLVNTFTTGFSSIDHNLYVHEGFAYEANYTTGLRIFDLSTNPTSPPEVGFFDTHPANDGTSFDGAWNVYPFFPSGTVIVSDFQAGLFVFDVSFAKRGGVPLQITYIGGAPASVTPTGGEVLVDIVGANGGTLDPASTPTLTITVEGTDTVIPLTPLGGSLFRADLPPLPCGDEITYHVTAQSLDGLTVNEPMSAPLEERSFVVASSISTPFDDDFEINQNWQIGDPSDTATTGIWVRTNPVGTVAQPEDDQSPDGALCFITGNAAPGAGSGDNDVDNGTTTLTSPTLDATQGDTHISYYRWYSNDTGGSPNADSMPIEISNDDGQSWTLLELVSENTGMWTQRSFLISDFVAPTSTIRVRFVARDLGSGSVVEAGVDEVQLTTLECIAAGLADLDGDGSVGSGDLALLLGSWGPCPTPPATCAADLDGDGSVGAADLALMLGSWG